MLHADRKITLKIFPKFCYFLGLLLVSFTYSPGQTVRGAILSKKTQEPLPYAHIGIVGTSNGTISDENGRFSLALENADAGDSVRISMLGYQPQIHLAGALKKQETLKILLVPAAIELTEVEVRNIQGEDHKEIGHQSESEKIVTGWSRPKSGGERGILLKFPGRKTALVEKIHFHIARSTYDSLMFRVHFYEAHKKWPGREVTPRDIFIKTQKSNGWVQADLEDQQIILESKTIVTLEIVEAWASHSKGVLLLSANLFGGAIYHKEASEDKWQKARRTSASIFLDVRY